MKRDLFLTSNVAVLLNLQGSSNVHKVLSHHNIPFWSIMAPQLSRFQGKLNWVRPQLLYFGANKETHSIKIHPLLPHPMRFLSHLTCASVTASELELISILRARQPFTQIYAWTVRTSQDLIFVFLVTDHLQPVITMIKPISLHPLLQFPRRSLEASDQLEVGPSYIAPLTDLFQMPSRSPLFYPVSPSSMWYPQRYTAFLLPSKRTQITSSTNKMVGTYPSLWITRNRT